VCESERRSSTRSNITHRDAALQKETRFRRKSAVPRTRILAYLLLSEIRLMLTAMYEKVQRAKSRWISHLPHARYMSRPFHPSWFWWLIISGELLIRITSLIDFRKHPPAFGCATGNGSVKTVQMELCISVRPKIRYFYFFNLLNPSRDYIHIPPALTMNKSAFFICVFRMILWINIDYFHKQHQPVDLCNGGVLCFLCGTDWIVKYYLDELRLQRINYAESVANLI
jgi:hypothetical protein